MGATQMPENEILCFQIEKGSVIAWGKIAFDVFVNFVLQAVDEGTDLYSGIRYILNGDPAFGALTLSLPFMPAICMFLLLPCAGKGVFKAAFESLPVVHLFNKYKALKEIITLHKKNCQSERLKSH